MILVDRVSHLSAGQFKIPAQYSQPQLPPHHFPDNLKKGELVVVVVRYFSVFYALFFCESLADMEYAYNYAQRKMEADSIGYFVCTHKEKNQIVSQMESK